MNSVLSFLVRSEDIQCCRIDFEEACCDCKFGEHVIDKEIFFEMHPEEKVEVEDKHREKIVLEMHPEIEVEIANRGDDWWDNFCNDTRTAKPTFVKSSSPTLSPTKSVAPSLSKIPSASPSISSAPTDECTCCDCVRSCSIQPDPHYYTWDGSWYDFQGGCDQYAIKNDKIEVQIATRPRNGYSTITQISVMMLQTNEHFKLKLGQALQAADNTILTGASVATTSNTYSTTHQINFDNVPSFIRINVMTYGLSLQVQGHGSIFSNSNGMCGNWNNGGVQQSDGTSYNAMTGPFSYAGMIATQATSFPLAQSWQLPILPAVGNDLLAPSPICDASKLCGGAPNAFPCNAVRRLASASADVQEIANPGCDKTCADLVDEGSRVACETDVAITNDTTWACQDSYNTPVIIESDQCTFEKLDDATCDRDGEDTCGKLGGSCIVDCEDNVLNGYVCLPGICSSNVVPKSGKKEKSAKNKAPNSRELKGKGKWKKKNNCMCMAPVACHLAP